MGRPRLTDDDRLEHLWCMNCPTCQRPLWSYQWKTPTLFTSIAEATTKELYTDNTHAGYAYRRDVWTAFQSLVSDPKVRSSFKSSKNVIGHLRKHITAGANKCCQGDDCLALRVSLRRATDRGVCMSPAPLPPPLASYGVMVFVLLCILFLALLMFLMP